ncbi:MAG: class I SAM-dependent methyltransferase [Candidatus Lokiarchaeota archaeon]|nr:class I SAM-dependent methyltransferase [Candidatus Lokiarchaeota archaeon]
MKENRSIDAYNKENRVYKYDDNMNKMHPNRTKMIEIAIEFLPFNQQQSLNAIDIGIGTGYFSLEFFKKFPQTHIIGVDGAEAMIEIAKLRLDDYVKNIEFKICDFINLQEINQEKDSIDVVFSSYALHHLNSIEKENLYKILKSILKKNGWILYADVIIADNYEIEERFQEIRIKNILERTRGNDNRFLDDISTRNYLDDLEKNENDQPQSLSKDIELIKNAGFSNVEILWKEYREMIICAQNK